MLDNRITQRWPLPWAAEPSDHDRVHNTPRLELELVLDRPLRPAEVDAFRDAVAAAEVLAALLGAGSDDLAGRDSEGPADGDVPSGPQGPVDEAPTQAQRDAVYPPGTPYPGRTEDGRWYRLAPDPDGEPGDWRVEIMVPGTGDWAPSLMRYGPATLVGDGTPPAPDGALEGGGQLHRSAVVVPPSASWRAREAVTMCGHRYPGAAPTGEGGLVCVLLPYHDGPHRQGGASWHQ